jgi:RNA polymerase sigma factor (sigma-70 family)
MVTQVRSLHRQKARHRAIATALAEQVQQDNPHQTNFAKDIHEANARMLLYPALRTLLKRSPRDAEIVIRRYLDDQSPSEIAQEMGLSANLVRVRLYRGLVTLKAILEPHWSYGGEAEHAHPFCYRGTKQCPPR